MEKEGEMVWGEMCAEDFCSGARPGSEPLFPFRTVEALRQRIIIGFNDKSFQKAHYK
jgi:hypothetical protein